MILIRTKTIRNNTQIYSLTISDLLKLLLLDSFVPGTESKAGINSNFTFQFKPAKNVAISQCFVLFVIPFSIHTHHY